MHAIDNRLGAFDIRYTVRVCKQRKIHDRLIKLQTRNQNAEGNVMKDGIITIMPMNWR